MRRVIAVVIAFSIALFLATTIGCTSVKPIRVIAGDKCARCGRSIVEPKLAGEVINGRLFATKYRTPACMAKYLIEHANADVRAIYVADYKTGRLTRVETAYFVKTIVDGVTQEVDFAAFRS
jgi:hypothetical protein